MGAFCGGVLTSLIKRVESRSILNHKHKSVMFLRIPRSLGKLFFFFQFLSLKEELLAAPSFKKNLLNLVYIKPLISYFPTAVLSDLLSSCLLELIKRADCTQISTASVWTSIRRHPIRPDKLTPPIHQQPWPKEGWGAGRKERILFPPIS